MATTDRTATARLGLGDEVLGRARPASRRVGPWRGWFVPARGVRPRLLDVLVALVVAFVQVAGTIVYGQDQPSPWAFDAFACALLGTAGGVGLGLFLGWALVEALASEGFTSFAGPTVSLAVVVTLGALVGVVASVRPAHRAAHMDVLSAIATE